MDFSKTVHDLHNFVRGLSPYPAAWTELVFPGQTEPSMVKVYEVRPEPSSHNLPVGMLETDKKTFLRIAASDGYLYLQELQLPGKKRMKVADLLNGLR